MEVSDVFACGSFRVDRKRRSSCPSRYVTGGYVCTGNCALPGRCARAYVDGWWNVNTHVSFYDTAGVWSDGMYVGPNWVAATTWGLRGAVTPNRIVWFRPPLRRPYAVWTRNPGCLF